MSPPAVHVLLAEHRGLRVPASVARDVISWRPLAQPMAPLCGALEGAALVQGGGVRHRASSGACPARPPPTPPAPAASLRAASWGRGRGRGAHSLVWTHVCCAAQSEQQQQQQGVVSPLRAPGGPGGRPESLAKQGQQYRAHDGVLYIRNFFDQAQVCARDASRLAKSTPACSLGARHSLRRLACPALPPQFDVLAAECARLKPRLKAERSSTAEHRLGCYVPVRTHARDTLPQQPPRGCISLSPLCRRMRL